MPGPYTFGYFSEETRALQKALAALNIYSGDLDGDFGKKTRDAVIDAQHLYAISPADGVVRADLLLELGIVAPKTSNPITDFFTGLALNAALNALKGLPIVSFLTGYKTYIVGIACILTGLIAMLGWAVPPLPALDAGQGWQLVLTGLGFLGLRAAVAKSS